jgi:hypothetical protein
MIAGNAATAAPENAVARSRKRRDLLELSIGYALVVATLWTPRPWQRLVYWATAAFLATVLYISGDGWKAMGLRTASFARSIWIVGVALLMAALAVAVAQRMHTLQTPAGPTSFAQRYWGYAIWAFAQQVLLQDFFLLRLLRLMRRPCSAAVAAAAIFSLAHLPSPILTAATIVWGYVACVLFLRHRNLYSLAAAHAILGIAMAVTVPGPVIHNMRVGLGYLTYTSEPGHHRSH